MARTDGLIHRKLPQDAVIHTREPVPPGTSDADTDAIRAELLGLHNIRESLQTIARAAENRANLVDEYNSANISGAGSSSQVQVFAQYEYMPEKIESILIAGAPASQATLSSNNLVNGPISAGQQITSITIPAPGQYTINWSVQLAGTTGAPADTSNYQLMLNGVQIATSVNPTTTGNVYQQLPVNIVTTAPNSVVSINTIGTPTTTANYRAALAINNLVAGSPISLQLGDRQLSLVIPTSGILVVSPTALLLGRNDPRTLTPAIPGVYFLELMGIADRRFSI